MSLTTFGHSAQLTAKFDLILQGDDARVLIRDGQQFSFGKTIWLVIAHCNFDNENYVICFPIPQEIRLFNKAR